MENTCSGQKGPPPSLVNLSERLYEKKNWRRWDAKMSDGDMARDRGKLLAKTPHVTRVLLHLKIAQNLINNNCL